MGRPGEIRRQFKTANAFEHSCWSGISGLQAVMLGLALVASNEAMADGPMFSAESAVLIVCGPALLLGGFTGWLAAKFRLPLNAAIVLGAILVALSVWAVFGVSVFGNLLARRQFLFLCLLALIPFVAALALMHWGQSRRQR